MPALTHKNASTTAESSISESEIMVCCGDVPVDSPHSYWCNQRLVGRGLDVIVPWPGEDGLVWKMVVVHTLGGHCLGPCRRGKKADTTQPHTEAERRCRKEKSCRGTRPFLSTFPVSEGCGLRSNHKTNAVEFGETGGGQRRLAWVTSA
jgi:hypothetical protein